MSDNNKAKTGQTLSFNQSPDDDATETRMRAALGLRGPGGPAPQQRADQARARHKFVQDGGVPVVMLNRTNDQDALGTAKARISELSTQLDQERTNHAATRRTLQEAQATIQGLQTRIAHSDLAHRDALAAAARALEAAQTKPEPKPETPEPVAARPARKPAIERVKVKPIEREQKPVRWWTPSYRAKQS